MVATWAVFKVLAPDSWHPIPVMIADSDYAAVSPQITDAKRKGALRASCGRSYRGRVAANWPRPSAPR